MQPEYRKYADINDYELLYMMHQKDDYALEGLFNKYDGFIWSLIVGGWQESMMGMSKQDVSSALRLKLYEACFSYNESKNASFYTYLSLCLVRRINGLKRDERRQLKKRGVIGSLDVQVAEDTSMYVVDQIENNQPMYDPKYRLEYRRVLKQLEEFAKELNEKERLVWYHMTKQSSYSDAAKQLGMTVKQYDNTVYRIRKNLAKFLNLHKQ